jgi:septum formation protein
MRIILGSSSPRRRELLGKITDSFEILSPDVDETPLPGEEPETFCLRAAKDKAEAIARKVSGEYLLISADTIVTIDGLILGKPRDHDDAFGMIERLQGRTHKVKTAITLFHAHKGGFSEATGAETTEVTFKSLSSEEIEQYLSSIHYLDKAGSYAAQEKGEMIIASLHGSMTNVIGFPVALFFRLLDETGISPKELS